MELELSEEAMAEVKQIASEKLAQKIFEHEYLNEPLTQSQAMGILNVAASTFNQMHVPHSHMEGKVKRYTRAGLKQYMQDNHIK